MLEVRLKSFYDNRVRRLILYLRREWLTLILAAAFAMLALDAAMAPLGIRDLVALRARRAQLEDTHQHLLASHTALKLKIQRLQRDNHYIERLIREQLGYVRPNELVYRFPADKSHGNN